MIKIEKIQIPAANLGPENPMPDIKNVSYIHAGYELTPAIQEDEKRYLGKGMISTMLPYTLQDSYDRRKQPRDFTAAVLENQHLRAVFLPELGGRLWSLFDKDLQRELLYVNPVFQPGNLGLRNAWFSGGVEFNVGIKGHNPLTCSPLWCAIDQTEDGEVLRLYEYERIRGVTYSVSAWLPEDAGTSYLRCRIENTEDIQKHMYWWTNIAVPENPRTRVIVPAKDAFLTFYNADHYLMDKTPIPISHGTDVSYPSEIASSRDFFYKIPPQEKKWIASAEADGIGLLHCSTKELIGRKLFVWGQSNGGRNWNEWLSEENSYYVEIQAGLAHTQMEHIPMPGNTVWEWTEAFSALQIAPEALHADYDCAVSAVQQYIAQRIGDPDQMPFPKDSAVTSGRIVSNGSGWGYLEETLRGSRISATHSFPQVLDAQTEPWMQLLDQGSFPEIPPLQAPASYVTGDRWLKKLEQLPVQNWFSLLHIGVTRYAAGNIAGAKTAWETSLQKQPTPWAYRNLSMLYRNELSDRETGRKLILQAFALKKDNPTLCKEVAMQLTADGEDALWLEIYASLSPDLQALGRLRMYKTIAHIHLGQLEEAAKILNADFVLNDVKEGELSVSHYWFLLYRSLYAKETGRIYDENDPDLIAAADKKYPLPKKLDFRMH